MSEVEIAVSEIEIAVSNNNNNNDFINVSSKNLAERIPTANRGYLTF